MSRTVPAVQPAVAGAEFAHGAVQVAVGDGGGPVVQRMGVGRFRIAEFHAARGEIEMLEEW